MASIDSSNLKEYQRDVLANNIINLLTNNELLTSSPIATKDNKLKTDITSGIIPAINSLVKKLAFTNVGVQTFNDTFIQALGDFKGHPEYLADLNKIDSSVIQAIIAQNKALYGEDLDNPIPLPTGKSISELLQSVSQQKYTTSSDITAYSLVGIDVDGKVFEISADNLTHGGKLLGMSLEPTTTGNQCSVQIFGEVTNPSWLLSNSSDYFVGINGQLTSNAMSLAFTQRVGKAKNPTTLILNIGECILLQ